MHHIKTERQKNISDVIQGSRLKLQEEKTTEQTVETLQGLLLETFTQIRRLCLKKT